MDKLPLINVLIISALMMYSVESLECYFCGYRTVNGGDPDELPDIPYCDDFSNPSDILTNCSLPGDCCASTEELYRGSNTELITKHGCGSDMGEIEGRHHYCSEHPDSCFNVEDSTFPDPNIAYIEVCFCSTERCNGEDPIFPTDYTLP